MTVALPYFCRLFYPLHFSKFLHALFDEILQNPKNASKTVFVTHNAIQPSCDFHFFHIIFLHGVSPQTVFTYPFHHAKKLQHILLFISPCNIIQFWSQFAPSHPGTFLLFPPTRKFVKLLKLFLRKWWNHQLKFYKYLFFQNITKI